MKTRITCISDTHTKHNQITKYPDQISQILPGGDILICSGDISSMGYFQEIKEFCEWFNGLRQYETKIFIAGNHDRGFEDSPKECLEILKNYPEIIYLQDDLFCVGEDYQSSIKIYGTPWQPEFYNWAFNLPRKGAELAYVWNNIPVDTEILITHGPAWGTLDTVKGREEHLGCELLAARIQEIKPKIHIFGHIHSGHGIEFKDGTLSINASVLNEKYNYSYKPVTLDFDFETKEYEILYK